MRTAVFIGLALVVAATEGFHYVRGPRHWQLRSSIWSKSQAGTLPVLNNVFC